MNLNYLIFRNLKKNIKNYYLYVFALIFSVALYFSFVTLQYDPAMDEAAGSVKGGAAIGAASVLLVAIVAVFLLYANTIFIKRRSKEIGLFQLIGLTKGKIFQILSAENLILYFGSMVVGIASGFAVSRLVLMILFKILQVDEIAKLRFSTEALFQTIIVFAAIYLLIMIMNYLFIKRQSILSLFRVTSSTQQRVQKMSVWGILVGLLGLALIIVGYYVSSQLFGGKFIEMNQLMIGMLFILASVIIGTYLFYKGSVSFIFNLIRKHRKGYLSISEVLSLSSIMFRMKSNALLLTIITTVSALAIGLLSLSYISYYSAGSSAKNSVPNDFSFSTVETKNRFLAELTNQQIAYKETFREPVMLKFDISHILIGDNTISSSLKDSFVIPVISKSQAGSIDVKPGEVQFAGYTGAISSFMTLKDKGEVTLLGPTKSQTLQLTGMNEESLLSYYYSRGMPTAIVDDSVYEKFRKEYDSEYQNEYNSAYYGIDITDRSNLNAANEIFHEQGLDYPNFSQLDMKLSQIETMGLIMFIVGFLGLTFLITSGCILYFKQMDESEEERPNYTILRKLGFTQGNLLRGIQYKQLFNFGIPLMVGLCHSYFAVKSGWFFFGTEMLTPMILVMVVYTVLYSIFGILSVLYYKKVIKESL
ncbi:bacitracin export permease protein BceB [Paenibacillus sp. J45TS6]|uniref:FtsX-like permease family protein n=1 Tax=Paenibacillus sp. J45TS6 TaxID=2807196 RepID=UPI001B22AB97|nr:FtsX-like permease family protein [Paenibacillus sp. J45TS6]GIP42434.1 bacitracin export permease protein BceB [Paenibacillus sp. J45TS6]